MPSAITAAVEERYNRGGLWAAITVMVVWHLARALPTSLTGNASYRPIGTGVVVWSAYLLIGVISAAIVLRGGGAGPILSTSVAITLFAGTAVVAVASPTGSCLDPLSWAYASAAWFALVALWRRPLPEFIAFCLLNNVVGLATVVTSGHLDRDAIARFVIVGYGICVTQIAILVGSRMLTATAARAAIAQEEQSRVTNRRLAAEAVHEARLNRVEVVQQTASTLLSAIASGAADLTDADTQQQLRIAVSRLRRLIIETDEVPDPLQHELRAHADAAEKRGVEVDLQASVGEVPMLTSAARRRLTEPVIEVLAAARTNARVTVVADRTEVAVAIVADATMAPPMTKLPDVDVSFDSERGLLWVQMRQCVPSPSPS